MLATGPSTETDLCNRLVLKEICRSGPRVRSEVGGAVALVAGTGAWDLVNGAARGWGASRGVG